MEDGLRVMKKILKKAINVCLNPCSCGRWSQRSTRLALSCFSTRVLILVLVEDGLRGTRPRYKSQRRSQS